MYRQCFSPMRHIHYILLISTLVLASCGGGGNESSNSDVIEEEQGGNQSASNVLPLVNAGSTQSVTSLVEVTLVGVASDSDGSVDSYLWTQTGGAETVTLVNSDQSSASFLAPEVAEEKNLEFSLTVTDNEGGTAMDSVVISITPTGSEGGDDEDGEEDAGEGEDGGNEGENEGEATALVSEKRGLGYGYHSVNDLAVLRGGIQWWYNWAVEPEFSVLAHYENYDLDFVPMAWDERFNEAQLRGYLSSHPNVKFLLGFNEPNFQGQANLTPAEAAAQWPRLEAIANDYNLKIVGPAVNFSPGGVDIPGTEDDSSPWEYLDAFFAACADCQVDYIAIHSYMKDFPAVEWYVGQFEDRYDQPIWLTEWASWDEGGPANVGDQMDYLSDTVRWLEDNPNVFRYAWFMGRTIGGADDFPYLDILGADGELTPLGGLYTSIPSLNYRYSIPARIEAEASHRRSGFQHEPTDDVDGYVNLGWTEAGDWLEYEITVPADGSYLFKIRAASSANDKQLVIYIDDQLLLTKDILNTGGEQTWQTFSSEVALVAGQYTLKVEAVTDGFNLNWFEIIEF